MKTLDNTIKYYELLMKYDDTSNIKKYELPEGYHYEFYKPGDEEVWSIINLESGAFVSIEKGLKHFHDFYDHFIEELPKRCFFIVDDTTNEKVATATISLLKEKEFGYEAAVDWVAIRKSYQGKKLARPLISKFVELARDLGHKSIILHTQTTTWLAAKLYLDYGFEILNKEEKDGWNILKTLIEHDKLLNYKKLPIEEIYDKRNVEIEKLLSQMYNTKEFNFSVHYKDNRNDVYAYVNNTPYEYKYFYDGETVILEEVENKKYKR